MGTLRRRGSTVASAAAVRVEQSGGARVVDTSGIVQTRITVTVLCPKTYDILNGDRFSYEDQLYEVYAIAPNVQVCKQAKAYLVQ